MKVAELIEELNKLDGEIDTNITTIEYEKPCYVDSVRSGFMASSLDGYWLDVRTQQLVPESDAVEKNRYFPGRIVLE